MSKVKKGVKYIDDIIRETAEELGRDEKEVKEVFRIHTEYVKELMDREDVYIIELPRLGNLFYNAFTQRNFASRAKDENLKKLNAKSDKLRQLIKEHSESIKTYCIYPQNKRANFYHLFKSVQKTIFNKNKAYASFKKIIKVLEEYSKKMYNNE